MKNEKISIIVPIYNSEKWLKRCIESVLSQTYKNLELILVNDGSKDNSEAICKEYQKKDKRIQYFYKNNSGTSDTRNYGLGKALGTYIHFLDSDDYIEEKFCETMIESIKREKAQLAICGFNIWKNGILLRKPHVNDKIVNIKENVDSYDYIHSILASPCNKVYLKEYIKNNFETNMSLGEDLTFNLGYLKNIEKIICISTSLYNVSLDNDSSLNRKFRIDRLDVMLSLSKKELDFCKQTYGKEYYGYNQYIYSYHYFFKEIILHKSKKDVLSMYKKYFNDDLENAINKSNISNKYYKIFIKILSSKDEKLIYNFLKIRLAVEKIMGKRK